MNEPEYLGKPLAYLDQNILDGFLDCIETEPHFIEGFLHRVQVVYSDISFQEIYRAGLKDKKYSDAFLNLLDKLNAIYIKPIMDECFKFTGKMRLISGSAAALYEDYISESLKYGEFINPLQKTIFAMYGGIQDYKGMADSQIEAQYSLLNYFEQQINILKNEKIEHPLFNVFIKQKENELEDLRIQMLDFEETVIKNANFMKQANSETDAHLAYRNELKINIDEINQLQFPNVLMKIWGILKEKNPSLDALELEDFFKIKNVEHNFEKIHAIYSNLNLSGFRPEKKVKNEKKFISAQADISHVAYASYCDYFFTNDERLADKSAVIYEYLKINTEIFSIPKFLTK
ncbi:hypothetical protein HYG93_08595 [Acinetobacter sp. SwsAc6]|uniref:hypothetical protein n=1 Tax=Acinetobacter sp. SwsAc6 TaxID=2749439 RepID=UPI0015BE7746|nr:hypothetical protein [Acinetobacter sp. SwsAc6]NWK74350.1 hypothetical protein [Acinetobacter sp. SwsAc6]